MSIMIYIKKEKKEPSLCAQTSDGVFPQQALYERSNSQLLKACSTSFSILTVDSRLQLQQGRSRLHFYYS